MSNLASRGFFCQKISLRFNIIAQSYHYRYELAYIDKWAFKVTSIKRYMYISFTPNLRLIFFSNFLTNIFSAEIKLFDSSTPTIELEVDDSNRKEDVFYEQSGFDYGKSEFYKVNSNLEENEEEIYVKWWVFLKVRKKRRMRRRRGYRPDVLIKQRFM